MCDTVVATGSVTADGVTLFGKNSDREPNEAQYLVRVPAARHAPGSTVRCTYLEIPQVAETCEVLLSKPFWMWGAEMGFNAHGVAIGNEAVFTREPVEKAPGLTGMDLLRLALERASTARAALDVITGLLAEYGQGGNCGFTHPFYYHNSFLLADPGEAWVLETAGRHWAAQRVEGVRTISNGLSIGAEFDLASDDLVTHAVEHGWCRGRDEFDFARCYSDFLHTTLGASKARRLCTMASLNADRGQITVATVIAALRSHAPHTGPARGLAGNQVCMHAGLGPVRASQTTGSLVCHLASAAPTAYVTATAAPCTSVFKPLWLGAPVPDTGPQPTGTYDPAALWWQHEALHRATLEDYPARIALYGDERDALERRFLEGAVAHRGESPTEQAAFAAACFAEAGVAEAGWLEAVRAAKSGDQSWLNAVAWRRFNREAGLPPR